MPLKPLFTDRDITRVFDKFQERADEVMLETLKYAGEHFVKVARDEKKDSSGKKVTDYNDITGNLRSSVGYIILRDGEIVAEDFHESKDGSDKTTGVNTGRRLARQLAQSHSRGYVLIGLAGMNYAVHVENIKGKDVITYASKATEQMLKELIQKIKR